MNELEKLTEECRLKAERLLDVRNAILMMREAGHPPDAGILRDEDLASYLADIYCTLMRLTSLANKWENQE